MLFPFVFPKINVVTLSQGNIQNGANVALGGLYVNQGLVQTAGNSANIHQR